MTTVLNRNTNITRPETGYLSTIILLLLALLVGILTPLLIGKGLLPAYIRWVFHAMLMIMIFGAFARMMVMDHVPKAVLVIIWISVIGIVVATAQGQGIVATIWGWWLMFQFPLIGLFCYLQIEWPERFPKLLRTILISILALEVIVQLGQYIAGEIPGDNLAGTFGEHGVAELIIFVMFVLCLALGRWLARGDWKFLILVLVFGAFSSVLGENKLFPFATLLLGMLAMGIYLLIRTERWKLMPIATAIALAVWGFFSVYNSIVSTARGLEPLQSYLQLDTLADYFGGVRLVNSGTSMYDIGRNYAYIYGWNMIGNDPTILLFGMGLGARGESVTLDTVGVGLTQGRLGITSGTSLLVLLQETGLLGLLTFAGFILWVLVALLKQIKEYPQSEANEIRYALLLFTICWPLWLWYTSVWTLRVPMLLYWAILGYVLSQKR